MKHPSTLLAVSALALACAPPTPTSPATLAPTTPWVPGHVMVRLEPGLDLADAERLAVGAGAYALRRSLVPGWWRLEVDTREDVRDVAEALATRSGVLRAQPSQRREPHLAPDDSRYPELWAHQLTHAERGWDVETGDPSVRVAVIGTGVAMTHQDLAPNIGVNGRETPNNLVDDDGNGFVDDVRGWDFADGDNDPSPVVPPMPSIDERLEAGHETSAAGMIAAVGNNRVGVVGVAWSASLVPIRFGFDTAGSAEAIVYAADLGVRVINMSYGSVTGGEAARDPVEEDAVEYAVARGVTVVASAGNDDTSELHFPAAYDAVIAVGASDRDDRRAEFSNFGPWVDVTAPGDDVLTTFLGGSYLVTSGTSFSAPYVAGLAALLWSAHPTWTADEVRRTIEFTGAKVYTDEYVGTRVDVGAALATPTPASAFARFVRPRSSARHVQGAPLVITGLVAGTRVVLEAQVVGQATWTPLLDAPITQRDDTWVVETRDLPLGDLRLRLRAVATDDEDVDWLALSLVQGILPGWPVLTDHTATAPVVPADLDGDGVREVIVPLTGPSGAHAVYVLDSRGQTRAGWPVALSAPAQGTPLVADLDGDDRPEVLVAERILHALHADGTEAAFFPDLGPITSVALGDLDGDLRLEVIVALADGVVWAFDARGVVAPGWPRTVEAGLGPLVVADLDGNGTSEVAVVGERRLHVLSGAGGPLLTTPVFVSGVGPPTLAAADLDADGALDLIVARNTATFVAEQFATAARTVSVFTRQGQPLAGWPTQQPRTKDQHERYAGDVVPLTLADLDGDGRAEVLFYDDEGTALALRGDGRAVRGWPASGPARAHALPTVADVDGDGGPDVLSVGATGTVMARTGRGLPSGGFPLDLGSRAGTPMVVTDVDADGEADVLVAGAGVHAYRLGAPHRPTAASWPLPRHDGYASGALPSGFALEARALAADTLELTWRGPRGLPPPARWAVYREGRPVARTPLASYRETSEAPSTPRRYQVVGEDVAGNVVGVSLVLEVSATEAWCARGDGTPCDDGDSCSQGDVCRAGVCSGTMAAADGTTCDDGSACTLADRCVQGTCTSTAVRSCGGAAGAECVASACDPGSGACVPSPAPDGAACDDGNDCTTVDACWLGSCRGELPATEGVDCNVDQPCSAKGLCLAGRCEGAFPYSDGTPCQPGDLCSGTGACLAGACEGATPLADGTTCDDDSPCTVGDACRAGGCAGGPPRDCGSADTCMSRPMCQRSTGACISRPLPDYASCDDGTACTQWDVCQEGQCLGQAPVLCSVSGQSCDDVSGQCVAPPALAPEAGCGCRTSTAGGESAWIIAGLLLLMVRRQRREYVSAM
jgi:subtilisin family serine protease